MTEQKRMGLSDLRRSIMESGGEAREELMFQRWYRGLLDRGIGARVESERTQADIAESLSTTQSSIARLERDNDGGVSVRRLWNYLSACGLLPLPETAKKERVFSMELQYVRQRSSTFALPSGSERFGDFLDRFPELRSIFINPLAIDLTRLRFERATTGGQGSSIRVQSPMINNSEVIEATWREAPETQGATFSPSVTANILTYEPSRALPLPQLERHPGANAQYSA